MNQPETHKFKGFENEHIEIWYDSRKESQGQTMIKASFMNKTQSFIDAIAIQTAVMKYLKIQINPLNSTALPASSKGGVYQVINILMIDNDCNKLFGWREGHRNEDKAIICNKWSEDKC